jgi:uncharacterized protein DUF4352
MIFRCMARLTAMLMLVAAGTSVAACDSSRINTAVPSAAIGQKVRDGTFDFTVTQVNGSRTFTGKRAQGVYVIVSVTAKNIGVDPVMFDWSAQQLKDSIGRQYSASFMVPSLYGDVVNAIDAGEELPIKLAFDVPPDTKPTQITLHESTSSEGAPVNLTQPAPPPSRH